MFAIKKNYFILKKLGVLFVIADQITVHDIFLVINDNALIESLL